MQLDVMRCLLQVDCSRLMSIGVIMQAKQDPFRTPCYRMNFYEPGAYAPILKRLVTFTSVLESKQAVGLVPTEVMSSLHSRVRSFEIDWSDYAGL